MLNALQIIAHMPLFDVSFPANANEIQTVLIKFATFDFLEQLGLLEKWIYFPNTGALDMRFEQSGYETKYFILNMGTVFFLMILFIIFMVVFKMIDLLLYRNDK